MYINKFAYTVNKSSLNDDDASNKILSSLLHHKKFRTTNTLFNELYYYINRASAYSN